ncbi:phosphoenolpyruvate synthase/pyruvate phosphate dikinase [Candidatus Scalindua japonica]|uniref:Phosphoenolpyruvate synthase/pyruvate phosphate dikinase n=1 Tax=Candidatus Scalindua japonica TaxID=1284222 RepID=A0A286U3T4_9BACT|nr:hypothetical protein [Candidatus Scalindua japonica]GAX62793.1 phosphoenolpyruvate synthase/pyruvate phosphate dikinase [Candidatus Scalindua japonica]
MREILLDIAKRISFNFNQLQKNFEDWFRSKFENIVSIKESYEETSSCTYEQNYTQFGKEREYLIDLHKRILEKEHHETEDLRILIQNFYNDYDELLRKYRGIIPLDYSTDIIPDKAHAEEGCEIETEILHFFPSNSKRELIIEQTTEIIKHVQEESLSDTPVWIKVTQHKGIK